MKNPKLRSHLLVCLMFVVSFIAAWLSVSLVRAGRAAQDGIIADDVARMPPADELRVGPYSDFNNPHLAGPDDPVEIMVELEDPPAIEAFLQAQEGGASFTGEAAPQAVAAVQARIARIEQAQATLSRVLAGPQFKAKITGSVQRVYNGIAMRVASGKLAEVHALPGVKAVHISNLLYPSTDTSVPFIGAHRVWELSGGGGYRGEGIRVAVLDSGIDYTHSHFGGSGNPADYNSNNPTVIGDNAYFPNSKVVGGVDLVGDNYNAADPNNNTPQPDPDPIDCKNNGHGTAVAGIAAGFGVNANGTTYTGNYNRSTNFSSFRIGPGVAPKATLLSFRVSGCNPLGATSNAVMTQAIDRAMDPNQDGNFSDRAHVVTMTAAAPFTTLPSSPVITAINNGAKMNVIYVGAAGNGGDTHLAVGGPAIAEGALAVVANADNGLFTQNIRVNSPGNIAGIYPGAVTEFGFPLSVAHTRPVVQATPNDGCAPLTNGSQVNGAIAFINSGACTPTTKARNAQAAGAVAVIIGNNTAALPISVRDDGTGSDIIIPSFLLAQNGGDAIRQELNGGQVVNVSLTPGDVTSQAGLANSYPSFNSYGGVYPGNILKPDIAAPGVNIGSAAVGTGNNYNFASGTSMAAPHVAGAAALLKQLYPDYTSRQIYDIVRSTSTGVFSGANSAPPQRGPSLVGGGGVNAEAAITTYASVHTSQVITATNLYGEVIEATDDSALALKLLFDWFNSTRTTTYNTTLINLANIPGATTQILNPTGTVAPNSILESPYTEEYRIGALKRLCPSWVSPTQAGNPRHCLPESQGIVAFNLDALFRPVFAPINSVVRPASRMGTTQTSLNLTGQTGTSTLNLTGQGVNNGPSAPADWRSLVSAFQLLGIDPNEPLTQGTDEMFDIQYVGARSNRRTASNLADTRLTFAYSTYGRWNSPNQLRLSVGIDHNRDGRDDYQVFNTSFPNAQGAPSDVFITRTFNLNTNTFSPQSFFVNSFSAGQIDTALYYTDVINLVTSAAALNLTEADNPINITFKTSFGATVVDQAGPYIYDWVNTALDFGVSTSFNDLPGGTIPVQYFLNALTPGATLEGVFLQHHLNTPGARAQILPANQGREGDVDPRPGGNGSNTTSDWVQLGRFAAGLDDVNLGNEFQRADCAPRSSGGNGQLTAADWVQAGRYAAGLDPAASATGPYLPIILRPNAAEVSDEREAAAQTRTLRALNASFVAGQTNTLDIELDALGGENAAGFSLNYDPTALSFVSAELGSGAQGAMLFTNTSQTATGRVGIALALPAGQGLQAGARRIATVRFNVVAGSSATATTVSFGDQIVARQLANLNADELAVSAADVVVTIVRAVASVSAASFTGEALASESIVAAFGLSLATRIEIAATLPLPTTLAGTTVKVKDSAGVERLAPLFFVSPGQINFLVPTGTATGAAMITVTSGNGAVSMGNVNIAAVTPGLFAANANGQGVAAAVALRVKADGLQLYEPVARFDSAENRFVPVPIDLGPESDQVFLILFGTGIRFRTALSAVSCSIGGVNTEVLYAGPQGALVGLDQLNVRLSRSLIGRGEIDLAVMVDGKPSNTVRISVK